MKKALLTIITLFTVVALFAQDKIPYAEKAAQLQKEIWGNSIPEFKATTVPADMGKEGAVVLARSYSLQRTSGNKIKLTLMGVEGTTKTIKLSTLHERVKINDKSALEAYSTLEYQKKLDKTVSVLLLTRFVNVKNTYVGAKIIKPDGKEVVINTSEEVLLKNETKDQKGKLALSGLQVGDILDYYVSNTDVSENGADNGFKDNDNLFMLADDYPVLYYSLDFQFNKKLNVRYIYANGAPHFTESHNEAGDLLLSLKIHDMAKYHGQVWTSPLRQYPYIEIGSSYPGRTYSALLERENDAKLTRFEANKSSFEKFYFAERDGFDIPEKKTKDFFKSSKAFKAAPVDSVLKVLYNQWKFNVFCNYDGKELEDVGNMNYRAVKSMVAVSDMAMMLTDMKIDYDVLLVASRNSNTLENVYNIDDMSAMIRINSGAQPMYMCFDDVFTHVNEIPARFQGEKAVVLKPKRRNSLSFTFTEMDGITLPVIAPDKNRVDEQLQVTLIPGNVQKLKVVRTAKQSGEMRRDDQRRLVPVMDVDDGYKNLANGDELAKRLSKSRETKKMAADFDFSFTKEKADMKKNFTAEIKSQFDQEPEQVENFKIGNAALDNSAPVFQYSSSFVLNGLVKKAGNNYIIDAGKLAGSFYKLEDKDRKRVVDVYMPCARSFNYTINIAIPPGYTAKGMEEMTRKKENKTGSFTSTATVNGNTLTITVKRVYANNFEKVANWPMVMELVDMASDFNTQKILFEKKG